MVNGINLYGNFHFWLRDINDLLIPQFQILFKLMEDFCHPPIQLPHLYFFHFAVQKKSAHGQSFITQI